MNKSLVIAVRAAAITCALLALPLAASAQDASAEPQAPRTQGPMTVERVKSGFVVTPEVKITSFDHSTSELIGADGGWLADKMFFIGGGGYWMVNQNHDRELAYGGLVVNQRVPADLVNVLRALVILFAISAYALFDRAARTAKPKPSATPNPQARPEAAQ